MHSCQQEFSEFIRAGIGSWTRMPSENNRAVNWENQVQKPLCTKMRAGFRKPALKNAT